MKRILFASIAVLCFAIAPAFGADLPDGSKTTGPSSLPFRMKSPQIAFRKKPAPVYRPAKRSRPNSSARPDTVSASGTFPLQRKLRSTRAMG
jgi:hypothetical protein